MFITGTDAAEPETYALKALETLLKAKFEAEPFKTLFKNYGGVIITSDFKEGEKLLGTTKRPLLYLDPDSATVREDESAQWGAMVEGVPTSGRRWLVEIVIECVVSVYSAPVERSLVRSLTTAVLSSLDALEAVALEEGEIAPGQGRSTREGRVNPHTFRCALHAIL